MKFSTMSTFGDIVYGLCVMRLLGGGELYVKLNALDDFCRNTLGWKDAGPATGRLTNRDFEIIQPLLKAQDYLTEIKIWNSENVDLSMDEHTWRYHLIKGWQGNLTEIYALTAGLNIHDPINRKALLFEPWLTPVEPIKIPGKPLIVNRTERHLYGANGEGWKNWTNNNLSEYGAFIGTEREHNDFENLFKIKIHYHKTEDLLEVARVIQGCEMFIGNQSSALSIAIGLGKTYWCEIMANYTHTKTPHGGYGDCWFPRLNGFYF